MKYFYFLSLMISALLITTDSRCMLTVIKRKKIYSPAQRNYCIKQSVILQKLKHLESLAAQQQLDLEKLKNDFNQLKNYNNQRSLGWKNDSIDHEMVEDSFIPQYNMHAPVREEKN